MLLKRSRSSHLVERRAHIALTTNILLTKTGKELRKIFMLSNITDHFVYITTVERKGPGKGIDEFWAIESHAASKRGHKGLLIRGVRPKDSS